MYLRRNYSLLLISLCFGIFFCPITAHADDVVRIGVLANNGAEQCLKQWKATADYLSEKTGKTFAIQPLDFNAVPLFVENKKVAFFLVNSAMYCEIQKKYGGEPLATLITKRQNHELSQFAGVVFVKADSPVQTIEDIKGKRFMCADKASFGGYQMAQRLLKQHGINPAKDCPMFKEAGTHEKVVEMLQKGVTEVGTVRTDTLEKLAAEEKCKLSDFRILNEKDGGKVADFPFVHSTELYPEWPFATCAHTDPELTKKVAEALIAMPKDGNAAKAAKCAGWRAPLDYTPVVQCIQDIQ